MRKRPLVVSAILFFIGILLSFYNLSGLITLVLTIFICSAYFIKKDKARLFSVALIIILLGAIRMNFARMHKDSVISQYAGTKGEMNLTIAEPTADGKTVAFLETDRGRIGVYLCAEERNELFCGDIVTGEITLRAPFESKIGANSFASYLSSRRVYLEARCENVKITGRYEKGIRGRIYSLRRYVNTVGENLFQDDRRALFNAMVFGDKSLLTSELYSSLQGSGLNHIAVVSGMHLSVVIAFIMLVTRKIFGNRRIGFVIAILCSIFITLITGSGASILRALLMCLLYYFSRILYRENDHLTSLFFAFWVMIIINPYTVFNVGFVLSVLSVLGIILFNEKLFAFFVRFMPRKVAEAIALTLSAQLAVTVVIVYYFGIITPYSPFSNIVAIPLSSAFVVLGMLLCILYPIKPLVAVLTPIMNFLADGIIALCDKISSLPGAVIEFGSDFLTLAVVWIFLVFMVYYHPMPTGRIKKSVAIFAIVAVFVSFVAQIEFDTLIFTPYGKHTLAQVNTKDGSFLLDCPDTYDLILAGVSCENIVITKNETQDVFDLKRESRRIYLPRELFSEKEKLHLVTKAKKCDARIFFKSDGEKFCIGSATLRYIAADAAENARALEINLSGKRIISLQGFSQTELEKIKKNREKFPCDYLYIPCETDEKESLSTGEIISNNKFVLQR